MAQIKTVIADEEKEIRSHLIRKLSFWWPDVKICGDAEDGKSALSLIKDHKPEIVFINIKMQYISGIEVARQITGKCLIVFIADYDENIVKVFEREAVDYILKPISNTNLKIVLKNLQNKIKSSDKTTNMSGKIEKISEALSQKNDYLVWIKYQKNGSVKLISVDDIYYLKSESEDTLVRTKTDEYLIEKSLADFENELNPNDFWRIQKSLLVNSRHMTNVQKTFASRYEVGFDDIIDTFSVESSYSHLFHQK